MCYRNMRVTVVLCALVALVLAVALPAQAQWYRRPGEAIGGAYDMYRAYRWGLYRAYRWGMNRAYRWGMYRAYRWGMYRAYSNAREWFDQRVKGDSAADSARDQEANRWGRNGGDLNKYRPAGLPSKY
ncbi:hypothetical protein HAZT_HAZT011256 [Hyalella azteca]|uniref:Uncharacterized protein n=1 Tax=Hyalella azteca TaxID=294128 RepID=A0A6A0H8J6_HYAAZ|nr:hypothetical protein HAZT_HAZT011256 [Hyalella azteca]